MVPNQLRTLVTGAGIILGGILTLNVVSSVTIGALRLATEANRVNPRPPKPPPPSSSFLLIYFDTLIDFGFYYVFICWVCGRESLRCLVRFVKAKDFTYANCAREILPFSGRLCMTQLPLTLACVQLVMEKGL